MDAIIGGPPPAAGTLGLEKCPTGPIDDPEARGQPGPWPEPGDPRPVISSGGYTHSLHHPIPDENYGHAGLMAALLEHYVEVNKQLLRCSDEDAKGLKLMQQFFRRTDLGPKPRNGCTSDGEPPRGWHMDQAFLPHHVSAAAPFHLRSLKVAAAVRRAAAQNVLPLDPGSARRWPGLCAVLRRSQLLPQSDGALALDAARRPEGGGAGARHDSDRAGRAPAQDGGGSGGPDPRPHGLRRSALERGRFAHPGSHVHALRLEQRRRHPRAL